MKTLVNNGHPNEHDYIDFSLSINLESIKSLHIYHPDIYFVKKVVLSFINCDETKELFGKRTISFGTRQVREVVELNADKNYIHD